MEHRMNFHQTPGSHLHLRELWTMSAVYVSLLKKTAGDMARWGPSEALIFSLLTTWVGIFVGIPWPPLDYTWSNSYSSVHDLMGVLRFLNFPIEAHVHSPRTGDPGHSSDFGIAPNRDQIQSLTMDGPCQYNGPALVSRSSHCLCPGQSCWTPVPHGPCLCALPSPTVRSLTPCRVVSPRLILIRGWV